MLDTILQLPKYNNVAIHKVFNATQIYMKEQQLLLDFLFDRYFLNNFLYYCKMSSLLIIIVGKLPVNAHSTRNHSLAFYVLDNQKKKTESQ